MQAINHQAINRHVRNYAAVEEFLVGQYTMKLYALYEKGFNMDYQYNFIAFLNDVPVVALGYEIGFGDTNFLGATLAARHVNLGPAPQMDLLAFRHWALQNIGQFLPELCEQELTSGAGESTVAADAVSTYTGTAPQSTADELQKIKRMDGLLKGLREFSDLLEYRYVLDFENHYTSEQIRLIKLDTIRMVIASDGKKCELVAIIFMKKEHTIEGIFEWLFEKEIVFATEADIEPLIAGKQIITAVKFDGYVAVCLAATGTHIVN